MYLPPYRYRAIPNLVGAGIVTVVIVLQILNLCSQIRHDRSKQKKKKHKTKNESNKSQYIIFVWVFGVMICNYYNLVMGIFVAHAWPDCHVCEWSISSISISFVVARVFNYLFFIQVMLNLIQFNTKKSINHGVHVHPVYSSLCGFFCIFCALFFLLF